jgi:uncharacterized membrane protein YhhN
MKKAQFFLFAFWAVALGDIISLAGNLGIDHFFKPAIVIMLFGYYASESQQYNFSFLVALLFGWIGDVLLMFTNEGELFFILGLLAFLIGHLFFILTFRQFTWDQKSNLLPTQKVRYIFPILLAGTGLITILYPKLGDLKIPVVIYAIVLMLMASFALLRIGRTSRKSLIWVFIGALLFMLSDSLLAINKFHSSIPMASIAIMTTYIAAQYMIVTGILKHPKTA